MMGSTGASTPRHITEGDKIVEKRIILKAGPYTHQSRAIPPHPCLTGRTRAPGRLDETIGRFIPDGHIDRLRALL
jgi:hypothetical protein